MFARTLAALALGLMISHSTAQAVVITQWNFNSNPADGNTGTGTLTPSTGTGTAALVGGTSATFASGDVNGGSTDPASGDDSGWNVTTFAAQGTGDLTRGASFMVSTAGFSNVMISYDLRHSNASSRWEQFQYTIDGGANWINFGAPIEGNLGDTWFNDRMIDLTGVTGVDDNALFGFRILATFAPSTTAYAASNAASAYATTGTWRFDMVTVNGVAQLGEEVPAPASLLVLAGLAGVGFLRSRNRQNTAGRLAV